MIKKMYSVKDLKVGVYNPPMAQNTHGEAERTFSQVVNDKNTTINQFPADYVLCYVGDYDDLTGRMTSLDVPQEIVGAVQLLRPNQAQLN